MKSYKKFILNLPEYLLVAAVLFYWMSTALVLNYVAIGLLIVIILQMIFKNTIIGITIPCIMILACFYMILALISEVREFPSFNSDAQTLLFVGLLYFLLTILVSAIMFIKYVTLLTKQVNT